MASFQKNFVVKNGLEVGLNGSILKADGDGLVGIATTQPSSTLDVYGDIQVTGVSTFSSDVTIGGNLYVTGSEVIIDTETLRVEDKNIVLGYTTTSSPTDSYSDGGGIEIAGGTDSSIISGVTSEYKTITWYNKANPLFAINQRVGIGTSVATSGSFLDVGGNFQVYNEYGDINVGGGITVSGIGSFSNDLYVNGNIYIGESSISGTDIYILGTANANNLIVSGSTRVSSFRAGISTFENAIEVNGQTTLKNDLIVDGFSELDSTNISETLNVVGISTFESDVDINAGIDVDGFSELDSTNISETLNVVGLSTFESNVDINAGLDVDGYTELDATNISETLNVVGLSTFESDVDINAGIDVDGHTELDSLNVSGFSTFFDLEVTNSAKILDLNFPSGTGTGGQTLLSDGSGNLVFGSPSIFTENRLYVSTFGSDTNDGKNGALRTIKKAAQLASLESGPVSIYVETGDYVENNPIIIYEDTTVIGDNLRTTTIRPQNAGKDMFRVRNGCYITSLTMKDNVDGSGVPQYTFDYAVAFDDPDDSNVSRVGYAVTTEKSTITRSPYIQNCSILSFLGANGVLVDGSKVKEPNVPAILEEVERPVSPPYPSQGKSMVANAFTMVSFGGTGWRCINDGYAQLVSCFQIFCLNGSYCQSGGYLSITNSATNFGLNALRSSGFSANSFIFDRGVIASNGNVGGKQTLKVIGLGRKDQNLYITKFYNQSFEDRTNLFKPSGISTASFDGVSGINTITNEITTSSAHGYVNGDTVVYTQSSNGPVGTLVDQSQYYVEVVGISTIKLYEDDSRSILVTLEPSSSGIHTLNSGNGEFFVSDFNSTSNSYQELTLDSTSYTFIPGRLVIQSSTSASGYALTYFSNKLIVAKESTVDFNNGSILDHATSPSTANITSFIGITTYYTVDVIIDSTVSGQQIQNINDLNEDYYLHFHRPSIINSSAHTWEYAGSGLDYNALPENGGQSVPEYEQVNENGGRVFTSGTNELGDFKVGDAITAFNRTGDIIFNNTVTIGELTSLRFSVGDGPEITEISTDIGLGDNEPGGALDTRITTQKAQRTFLNNRLGTFIDKNASTSSVPNAVVVLNSSGQINAELIPTSGSLGFYTVNTDGGRTGLVDDIPANNLLAGDYVVESTGVSTITYQLINDSFSQYFVLSEPTRDYNFTNGQLIVSTNTGAIGFATAPTSVGYGTTANVKGVLRSVETLYSGSGYTPGLYSNVSIATSTGIGSSSRADVTVSAGGQIVDVDLKYGGKGYQNGDILIINSLPISGTNYAEFGVTNTENRLYVRISGNTKFSATASSPDFIEDGDAVGIQTSTSSSYLVTFDASTDVDTGNNSITVGINSYSDGDPVIYSSSGNPVVGGLTQDQTYYVKKVGINTIELYTNYGLTSILSLNSSSTGNHELDRVGINTTSNFILVENHGYSTGNAVRVNGTDLPGGITDNEYYFVGSIIPNGFTLHEFRTDSLSSVNGLTVNSVDITSSGSGIVTFTKQNVQFNSVVNTSSAYVDNYSILSTNNIDASNIITGTISPSRLGSGSATQDTFLSGDSTYKKVITGVGIGSTEPIDATSTAGFDNSDPGITTYFGNVNLKLRRVDQNSGDSTYTNVGVSKFKKSTFSIGGDGEVSIKSGSLGDVDADKLDGQQGSFYLDPSNLTSAVPVNKGGTNLTSSPQSGSVLVGNGVGYDLTINPSISGTLTVQQLTVTGVSTFQDDVNIGTGGTTAFFDVSTGYIGIGTTNPTQKLHVQDNAVITSNLYVGSGVGVNRLEITNAGQDIFRPNGKILLRGGGGQSTRNSIELTNNSGVIIDGGSGETYGVELKGGGGPVKVTQGNFLVGTATSTGTVNQKLQVDSGAYISNNLGIGTTNPQYNLDVGGDINFTGTFYQNSSPFVASRWTAGTGDNIYRLDGDVGIGTTNPIATLDVRGDGEFQNLYVGRNHVFNGSPLQITNNGQDIIRPNGRLLLRSGTTAETGPTVELTNLAGLKIYGGGSSDGVTISGGPEFGSGGGDVKVIQGNFLVGTATSTGTVNQKLQVDSGAYISNNLGIGTTNPPAKLSVEGDVFVSGIITSTDYNSASDINLKTDISVISNPIEKISQLNGVNFTWKESNKKSLGVIAQEVEQVIPELVSGEDPKTVNYNGLIGLLIECVKEQQSEINYLKNEINEIKKSK